MSERERQAKLVKLKLQERKLRREGKFDEAATLMGDLIKDQAGRSTPSSLLVLNEYPVALLKLHL